MLKPVVLEPQPVITTGTVGVGTVTVIPPMGVVVVLFASSQVAVVPPFDPVQDQVYELVPLTLLALVPEEQE